MWQVELFYWHGSLDDLKKQINEWLREHAGYESYKFDVSRQLVAIWYKVA